MLFKTGNIDMSLKFPFLISVLSIAGSTLIVTVLATWIIKTTKLKSIIEED